jgi:hypothetical protein
VVLNFDPRLSQRGVYNLEYRITNEQSIAFFLSQDRPVHGLRLFFFTKGGGFYFHSNRHKYIRNSEGGLYVNSCVHAAGPQEITQEGGTIWLPITSK